MNLKKVYKSKIKDSSCTWRFKVCDPQSGDCIDQDITASNGKQALLDLYEGLPESYEVINMQCISGDPIAYMKKSDCAACGAAGLAGAANVDGNAIITEADMGPMVPGGLKKKKKVKDSIEGERDAFTRVLKSFGITPEWKSLDSGLCYSDRTVLYKNGMQDMKSISKINSALNKVLNQFGSKSGNVSVGEGIQIWIWNDPNASAMLGDSKIKDDNLISPEAAAPLLEKLQKAVKGYIYAEPNDYGYRQTAVDAVVNGYFVDYDNWHDFDSEPPMKVTESGLFELAYTVFNYDLICVTRDGKVDVKNSNHPDIAKIMMKLVPQSILVKVYRSLIGDSKISDSDSFSYDEAIQEAIMLVGLEWRYLQNGEAMNTQDAEDLSEAVGMLEGIVRMNPNVQKVIDLLNQEADIVTRSQQNYDECSEHLGRAVAILKQCAKQSPRNVGDSKIEDSAHTWKVYYLDTQRQRTNCIFVKAFSFFKAISLAKEKLPNYCVVQSATDTTPFAEDDEDED